MTSPAASRNRTLTELRVDRITRDDGRYLLYYDWPDEAAEQSADGKAAPPAEQQPWTPDSGPAENGRDV